MTDRTDGHIQRQRAWDSLLPLLIGIVVGMLSTFAIQSGRLAALETSSAEYSHHFDKLDRSIESMSADLATIRESLAAHSERSDRTDRRTRKDP